MKTWKYYNHAVIPALPPNQEPNTSLVESQSFWKHYKNALLARWTTEFDCGYETNWWYVIKDAPLDISKLKAKRRYEINKGIRNFEVKEINPLDYKEELYSVQIAAFSAYPDKYRPTVEKQSFIADIDGWKQFIVFGAFFRESNKLGGYALLSKEYCDYVDFKVLKTKPDYERYAVNAALVEGVLQFFHTFLSDGGYICDGSRSINHETAFQDYLEKYFGFRKAYCHLHMAYNPKIKYIMKLLFPLRKFILKLDETGMGHQLNSVLRMEEICRNEGAGL